MANERTSTPEPCQFCGALTDNGCTVGVFVACDEHWDNPDAALAQLLQGRQQHTATLQQMADMIAESHKLRNIDAVSNALWHPPIPPLIVVTHPYAAALDEVIDAADALVERGIRAPTPEHLRLIEALAALQPLHDYKRVRIGGRSRDSQTEADADAEKD